MYIRLLNDEWKEYDDAIEADLAWDEIITDYFTHLTEAQINVLKMRLLQKNK
jgi:hypothetical protein